MSESVGRFSRRHVDNMLSAISAGFFLISLGMILVITPGLIDRVVAFCNDFNVVQISRLSIYLPAPQRPEMHLDVYTAAMQFSMIWAIFLVAILVIRFIAHSPTRKKAENLSDIVFWFGATYLIQRMLIDPRSLLDQTGWFAFWTAIIMLIGTSLIARAAFLVAVRKRYT